MRNWPVPTISTGTVFDACVERFRDPQFIKRVQSARPAIVANSVVYARQGDCKELHLLRPQPDVPNASNGDLKSLYNQGLLRRRSSARDFYDALLLSTGKICSVCDHRDVKTLDHYLPKSEFGAFTVSPQNLIPACYECNFSKQAKVGASFVESPLHPYFDLRGVNNFLEARLIEKTPIAVSYQVRQGELEPDMARKIEWHLRTFDLKVFYGVQAAGEMNRNLPLFSHFFKIGGGDQLRQIVQKKLDGCRNEAGFVWRATLYAACLDSEWFMGGHWVTVR